MWGEGKEEICFKDFFGGEERKRFGNEIEENVGWWVDVNYIKICFYCIWDLFILFFWMEFDCVLCVL